jgi:hypothetical protein
MPISSKQYRVTSQLVSYAVLTCAVLHCRELEASAKTPSALFKLLKALLNGSFDHDTTFGIAAGTAPNTAPAEGMLTADSKQLKSVHESIHSGLTASAAPADLVAMAFYVLQVLLQLNNADGMLTLIKALHHLTVCVGGAEVNAVSLYAAQRGRGHPGQWPAQDPSSQPQQQHVHGPQDLPVP